MSGGVLYIVINTLLGKRDSEMGCVFSKGKVQKGDLLSFSDEVSKKDEGCHSGKIRVTPARAGAGKVPEMSSFFGRAGIAGLERAVDVLDTLGSSMSNLNSNSGFISKIATRGNKISILAFEVANTIAKGANLLRTLSEENIQFLKQEVLPSHGVRELISVDARELMTIAAADKRDELNVLSAEVIRFGNLCKDPVWHNLGRYFQTLGVELTPQEQFKEEVETMMQQLVDLAQNTSELYHELHALDRFEQDYQRKLQEEESIPAARRENLMILHSELKRQRKVVKDLKKRSLWSRSLEEVVEKLVDIASFLYKEIFEAFGVSGTTLVANGTFHNKKLGVSGLALHYANVITQIDNIVSRPLSLPPNTRDTLYHRLPTGIKTSLRSRLQSFDAKEEYTVAQIKAEMQKTLKWIVPLAENTTRAHQGFGWVGEWANICTEVNKMPAPQCSITRIQTLYHADKEKTEEYILELVVWLHHLVLEVRNRGYGFKALKPARSQSQKGKLILQETKQDSATASNGKSLNALELSEVDREMLENMGLYKTVFGRSKSLEAATRGGKVTGRSRGWSRSCGNSPTREFSVTQDLGRKRTKVLDVLDGLDTLQIFPSTDVLYA